MNDRPRAQSAQIEVRPYKVEDLLTLAREGRIRIPLFRHPPRWRSAHVIELFDSIVQGFPVGTLLLATRDEPEGHVRLGAFSTHAPFTRDALIVVDGQQRVSAIVGALLHPSLTPRGDVHAIWYDLEGRRFVRASGLMGDTWVPVRVLGDSKFTLRWMRDWPLATEREDLVDQALSVGKHIREFQLACAVVPGDDEQRLRRMFHRLNTSGASMRAEEVFKALFRHDPETDLVAVATRVASAGFGEPTDIDVRQCLLCVGGFDPGESAAEVDAAKIRALIPRAEQAMRSALAFLAVDAALPRVELLPYRLPLRILARFFDRHPTPSDRARTLLKRWVWRGAMSGLFATSSEARVRALQTAIDDRPAEVIAQSLLREAGAFSVEVEPLLERWSSKNARSRYVAAALLAHGPRRPSDGEVISAELVREVIMGAEDPAFETLGEMFLDVAGRSRGTLAGRVLVSDPADDLAQLADASNDILESHLIPLDARDAFRSIFTAQSEGERVRAAERFDALRAPTLRAWTERFLRAQCEPGADDRVSIATVVAPYHTNGGPP